MADDIQAEAVYPEDVMKVSKWGNGLAVRIPKDVAAALGLKQGDEVDLEAELAAAWLAMCAEGPA